VIIINQNQIGNNAQPGVLHGIVFRLAPHNPVNFSLLDEPGCSDTGSIMHWKEFVRGD
jgi:hypothetical protein